MTELVRDVLAILGVVSLPLDIVALVWAWKERKRNRNFKQAIMGLRRQAQVLAQTCTNLEKDCLEGEGKVSSVKDAGGRAKDIAWSAHGLLASIEDALKETKR